MKGVYYDSNGHEEHSASGHAFDDRAFCLHYLIIYPTHTHRCSGGQRCSMPVNGRAVVIGGGTFSHVRTHLALAAPAFGATAVALAGHLEMNRWPVKAVLTRMAGGEKHLETNEDVAHYLDSLLLDHRVKLIAMNAALCDYGGSVQDRDHDAGCEDASLWKDTPSGKRNPRLKTSEGDQYLHLLPAEKVLNRIRKNRKDIFLIAFKTTTGASHEEQYRAGLELLKKSSCNLVLANDVVTRYNMIITPEQAIYSLTADRTEALRELAVMATARANLSFTRSTVIEGAPVQWSDSEVPESLRKVVNHLVARGAYKPFLGSTVGHFAVKVADGRFLTSIRRSNFKELDKTGLVLVETQGTDQVIAHGARPSVGGQSQRLVFGNHPDVDCIVHAHVPFSSNADDIPVRSQWRYECGSHECGENTSKGLKDFDGIKAVMLDQHGPNIVFNRSMDPDKVIAFIERNWDLTASTDGVLRA